MRPDLDAATLALRADGDYDVHYLLTVENGSGTPVDLSLRIESVSRTEPDTNQPIAIASIAFMREREDAGATSLSPLVTASTLNVLDDGITYSQLLQVGRNVVLKEALTARGGTRPVDASALWYEVFRGRIRAVNWPEWEGNVSIACLDQSGELQKVKSETAYTYAAGTAIETANQAVFDNNGHSSVVLYTPAATSNVLGAQYAPGVQKTVWAQAWGMAQSIGWVEWWRYRADGLADMTLFEPDRAKASSDFTFPKVYAVRALSVDESEIFNVLYGIFTDANGVRQTVGPVEDATSIAKYGGFRRVGWIVEEPDSVVKTTAQMTAMLNDALSDLKDPDAVAEIVVPHLLGGEVAVDLYTVPSLDRLFDNAQTWAPFSIRHEHRIGDIPRSIIQLRGAPTAGSETWKGRASDAEDAPETKLLQNFRARDSADGLSEVITWTNGAKLEEVWIAERTVEGVVTAADWTALRESVESKGLISTYTVTKPTETDGTARTTLVQIEGTYTDPVTGDLVTSDAWVRVIRPKVAIAAIDASTGDLNADTVGSTQLVDGAVLASKLLESSRSFGSSLTFSASDNDTVAWTSGSITLADGTSYSITASDTGNMLAATYIYLDPAVSTTALQTTTTMATAVGERKILVCFAKAAPASDQRAFFVPAVGVLGLNSDHISPKSISTNHLQANSVTATEINVANLAAISADLGTVTAGTIATTVSMTVGASTNYESGYDPTTKETPAGAQAKADTAEADAKTYADGKAAPLSAIIRSATAPTTRSDASALVQGDQWIDTDDGLRPYIWNGSAWTEAYTSIKGGSIKTGAIQSTIHTPGSAGWNIDFDGSAEFQDVTIRGKLESSTVASDGANDKLIPKGVKSGTVTNGGVVTFEAAYNSAPLVIFSGGSTWEDRAKWGTKAAADDGTAATARPTNVMIAQAVGADVTTTGFTASLRLVAKGSTTAKSASFATPTTVTAAGSSTGSATPADADTPSVDDRYTAEYTINIDNSGGATEDIVDVEVAMDVALDAGAWSEVASQWTTTSAAAASTGSATDSITATVTSVDGGNDTFRLRVKTIQLGVSATFTNLTVVAGALDWSVDSGALYASMTPNGAADAVQYFVVSRG